jgi:hypothetical protein
MNQRFPPERDGMATQKSQPLKTSPAIATAKVSMASPPFA